jgi:SAM-dependent methyltransferase
MAAEPSIPNNKGQALLSFATQYRCYNAIMLPVPPAQLSEAIGGSFTGVGREFFWYLVALAKLKPSDHFLDVGCGCGRIAVPLTEYLTTGRYYGFDVDRESISWCLDNIANSHDNFQFKWVNVRSSRYSPNGSIPASEFAFPYPRRRMDCVAAVSVFTHLLAPDADHYILEVSRVLRPGGMFLLTCFLLNADSARRIGDGLSSFPFYNEVDKGLVAEVGNPEGAVCLKEEFMASALDRYGLKLEAIHYGGWCGRDPAMTGQDLVLARKLGAPVLARRKLLRALKRVNLT